MIASRGLTQREGREKGGSIRQRTCLNNPTSVLGLAETRGGARGDGVRYFRSRFDHWSEVLIVAFRFVHSVTPPSVYHAYELGSSEMGERHAGLDDVFGTSRATKLILTGSWATCILDS